MIQPKKCEDGTYWIELRDTYGRDIADVISIAIQCSRDIGQFVHFTHNGVKVTVGHTSDPALILRDWHRAQAGYIPGKCVVAYPERVLSPETLANDARINRRKTGTDRWETAAWALENSHSYRSFSAGELLNDLHWEDDEQRDSALDGLSFVWGTNTASLVKPEKVLQQLARQLGENNTAVIELERRLSLLPANCLIDMEQL